jgi:hypothetical protein
MGGLERNHSTCLVCGRMFIERLAVRGLEQLSEWPEDVTPIGSSRRSARPGDLGVAQAQLPVSRV